MKKRYRVTGKAQLAAIIKYSIYAECEKEALNKANVLFQIGDHGQICPLIDEQNESEFIPINAEVCT